MSNGLQLAARAAVCIALITTGVSASAAVIEFGGPFGIFSGDVVEGAFTYTTQSGVLFQSDRGNPGFAMEGRISSGGGILTVKAVDSSEFSFLGVDGGGVSAVERLDDTLAVTGFRGGNAVATANFALAYSANNLVNGWTSFGAGSLANLSIDELRFDLKAAAGSNFYWMGVDNIRLGAAPGAIPEPATWAMLIAGFGLVGTALRRRSARPA